MFMRCYFPLNDVYEESKVLDFKFQNIFINYVNDFGLNDI